MELVKVENGTITVAESIMKQFHDFQVAKAEMEMKEKEVREAILNAMEQNGIKRFENDFMIASYKEPSLRKTVDTKALKEQGLYDNFTKESTVKASVTLIWK